MEYHEASLLLGKPAVKLLRADTSPAILSFFIKTFKAGRRVTIAEGELRGLLESHVETLSGIGVQGFRENPTSYLDDWCASGYLKKYWPDGANEPVFELTSGSEKAIEWLESLRTASFVGTESRLQRIFDDLENIVQFATPDVMVRLKGLRDEIAQLEAQIFKIETTGEMTVFSSAQINERYQLVLATARQLLGDFRQLEDNFKDIGQEIAEHQTLPGSNRGSTVLRMLDAYQALRQSPQGESFYGFWRLLLTEDSRTRFTSTLKKVTELEGLDQELKNDPLLRDLISRLLMEGEKVFKSNERMATNLRKALEKARQQESKRILELIQEIQSLAIELRPNPPREPDFFDLEEFPPVWGTMSRGFWHPPESITLEGAVEEADGSFDAASLRRLSNLPQVQLRRLRKNVEECLSGSNVVSLAEVARLFPPEQGLIEILGYIIIADADRRHIVSEEETETIPINGKNWRLPFVLFSKES
jgi:hypothetical protein